MLGANIFQRTPPTKVDWPWDSKTTAAALTGHLDILRWAVSNGCDWCRELCLGLATDQHREMD
jgi:hypothetical protein